MLVVARRRGDKIRLKYQNGVDEEGRPVFEVLTTITVNELREGIVKLGVEAPLDIVIERVDAAEGGQPARGLPQGQVRGGRKKA